MVASRGENKASVIIVLVLLFGVVGVSIHALGLDTETESIPRPFDPPTPEEQTDAIRIAENDPRVASLTGDDYISIGVALHTTKAYDEQGFDSRLVDVWFYNYDNDTVVWPVVDLTTGQVVRIVPAPEAYQPPLTGQELARATELTAENATVITHLGAFENVETTGYLLHGEGTPCPENRCVVLGFILHGEWFPEFYVIVNLSHDRVQRVAQGGLQEAVAS